jgi:hypothetical protein
VIGFGVRRLDGGDVADHLGERDGLARTLLSFLRLPFVTAQSKPESTGTRFQTDALPVATFGQDNGNWTRRLGTGTGFAFAKLSGRGDPCTQWPDFASVVGEERPSA